MIIIPVEACTAENAAAQAGEGVLGWGVPHSPDFHPESGMKGSCPGLTVGVGGCRMGRRWAGRGSAEGAEKKLKKSWGLGGSAVQLEGSIGGPEGVAAAVAGERLEEVTEEAVVVLMSKPAVAAAAAVLVSQREHMGMVVDCIPAQGIAQRLKVYQCSFDHTHCHIASRTERWKFWHPGGPPLGPQRHAAYLYLLIPLTPM